MNSIVVFLLSEAVLIPLVIGLIKLRRMEKSFRPFVFLLLLAVLTELVSYFIYISLGKPNDKVFSVYSLLEAMLIFSLFHGWGFLGTRRKLYYSMLLFFFLFWLAQTIFSAGAEDPVPFFVIFYSFTIVLISINQINLQIIAFTDTRLLKNPKFLISIGFVIYFTYQILYESAYYVSEVSNKDFALTSEIIKLFMYINLFVNLLYVPAVIFIPDKTKFSLRKSFNFGIIRHNE